MHTPTIKPIQVSSLIIKARTGVIGGLLLDNGDGEETFLDSSHNQVNLDGVLFDIDEFVLDTSKDIEGHLPNTEDGFLYLKRSPFDGEVMGLDSDGSVLTWNSDTNQAENTSETPEEYGFDNMSATERKRVTTS